jgi:hypothetical protein
MAGPGNRGIAKPRWRVGGHDVLGDQKRSRSLTPLDLARELLEQLDAASHRDDLDTFGSQPFCDRPPDPHTRPGNERSLSDKLQVHHLSSETPRPS